MSDRNIRGVSRRYDLEEILVESPFELLNLQNAKILPEVNVSEKSEAVLVKKAGTGKKVQDTSRAEGAGFNRGSWTLGEVTFSTKVAGHEEGYDIIEDTTVTDINQDTECSIIARDTVYISRENRVAQAVYDTTLFTGAKYTMTPATKWDDAGAKIKQDVKLAGTEIRRRMGIPQRMQSLLLASDAIDLILDQTAIRESIKYLGNQQGISIDLVEGQQRLDFLARYLRIGEIVELESFADISDLGLDSSETNFDNLWNPDFAMLAYLNKTASFRTGGLGVQPVFTPYTDDIRIEDYIEPAESQQIIRASEYRGQYVNRDFGFLFTDILDTNV